MGQAKALGMETEAEPQSLLLSMGKKMAGYQEQEALSERTGCFRWLGIMETSAQ